MSSLSATEASDASGERGRRIALATGAVLLVDDKLPIAPLETLFSAERWSLTPTPRGRGDSCFVEDDQVRWVWRPFRRGGLVGRIVKSRYLFLGEERVRAFREWRLLAELKELGLPVPRPVAARYHRRGFAYSADLLVERVEGAETLSARLPEAVSDGGWEQIGRCLRRFHDHGVYHADLNAHNVLLVGAEDVYLIDFDRGELREPGSWREANLARLRRSLDKLAPGEPAVNRGWDLLLSAYTRG